MKHKWKCIRNSRIHHRFFEEQNSGRLAVSDQSGYRPEETDDGILWVCKGESILLHEDGDSRLHLSCRVISESGDSYSVPLGLAEAMWLHRQYKMPIQPEAATLRNSMLPEIVP
jgi:hypothetical protein